jgi:hypothetical protein
VREFAILSTWPRKSPLRFYPHHTFTFNAASCLQFISLQAWGGGCWLGLSCFAANGNLQLRKPRWLWRFCCYIGAHVTKNRRSKYVKVVAFTARCWTEDTNSFGKQPFPDSVVQELRHSTRNTEILIQNDISPSKNLQIRPRATSEEGV